MKILKNFAAATLLAAASMSSHAGLVMTIDDLSTSGVDWTSAVMPSGSLVVSPFAPISPNWALSLATGMGNGWSSVFGIDLNSISASSFSNGTSTLRITFTETDLNFGSNLGSLAVSSAIGGTTQGTISYTSWIDDSNAAFGHGQQLFTGTSSGGAFSASGDALAIASDPFSLTLQVDITHTGAKVSSFDFAASVPEPGSLALMSVALLGAGLATRRRVRS